MYFKIYCAFDIRFNYHRIVKFSPGGLKMADSTGQLILSETVVMERILKSRIGIYSNSQKSESGQIE